MARLSLKEPEFVAVYEKATKDDADSMEQVGKEEEEEDSFVDIPLLLKQSYAIVQAPEKLDILWSFIKSHTRCKIIVFFTSCKQVSEILSS